MRRGRRDSSKAYGASSRAQRAEVPVSGPVRALVIGASGRMGLTMLRLAPQFPGVALTGALVAPGSPAVGQEAGALAGAVLPGLRFSDDLPAGLAVADVAIDFSTAAATAGNLDACHRARKPLLVCTTGWPQDLGPRFDAAARDIPLLVAANTSLGVTVLAELVRAAARALPGAFDIAVTEAHHRHKRDSPSGTALALRRAAEAGRAAAGLTSRIDIAAVRAGDIVGDHTVIMAGEGEELLLGHRAGDRAIFARGALQGAVWLAGRPPGRYQMRDVLGLENSDLR
ncbi:MAG: 4-hydroxy-tetrahydrodipicolinate reductase [Proteobacteria bacterium]|nr:4-hydroxy-tetrahydrodipicolinate reductase [Pseudomonadota bacterium]